MLAASAACLAMGVAASFASGMSLWYWLFLGILLALMVDMIILSLTVRRASYAQIEGMPGATKAVLDTAVSVKLKRWGHTKTTMK